MTGFRAHQGAITKPMDVGIMTCLELPKRRQQFRSCRNILLGDLRQWDHVEAHHENLEAAMELEKRINTSFNHAASHRLQLTRRSTSKEGKNKRKRSISSRGAFVQGQQVLEDPFNDQLCESLTGLMAMRRISLDTAYENRPQEQP